MTGFPYDLAPPPETRLGLIVLRADETIEHDFHRLFDPAAVRLHVTRIPSGDSLTPDSIAAMEARLPEAAGLLPAGTEFAAIGYACTSGTMQIGADRVAALVRQGAATAAVTDPLSATLRAAAALGLRRVGVVSPYIVPVAEGLRRALEAGGLEVPGTLTFGEEVEARVARIDPASIAAAARALAARGGLDGVFLSCTNLRTLDIIGPLEADLGLPVLSSNTVLAWDMTRLSGGRTAPGMPGRLFTH